MKTKVLMLAVIVAWAFTGGAFAMMGDPGHGGGHMGGGTGHGMVGAGNIIPEMRGNVISYGYLQIINPLTTPEEARAAVQSFLNRANSILQISELWEYSSVYKAELSDTNGAKAFDVIANKFTGVVMPEMGMSMMLNASYGKSFYKKHATGRNLKITPDQAQSYAQIFIDNNALGYILGIPETYPGYYKFHTTTNGGGFGMDIMVNGYHGSIWMDTWLGLPLVKY